VTPSPFLSTAVIAPVALRAFGADAKGWLEGIAAGELVIGAAFTEAFSVREGAGWHSRAAGCAGSRIWRSTRTARIGSSCRSDPIASRFVRRGRGGVTATRLATDRRDALHREVGVRRRRARGRCSTAQAPAIARALDAGRIALAAGRARRVRVDDRAGGRLCPAAKQFRPRDRSFQAVKHLCAEMIAALEPARSLLWYAAHSFDALPDEAPQMACHVLAHVSEIGREIASTATQVHGGIGWTDEQNLHFWFKRIAVARHLLGGPGAPARARSGGPGPRSRVARFSPFPTGRLLEWRPGSGCHALVVVAVSCGWPVLRLVVERSGRGPPPE
jgi:hypothetical protein